MVSQGEIVLLKKLYGIESRAEAIGKLDVLRGAIVTLTKQVADVEILVSELTAPDALIDVEPEVI